MEISNKLESYTASISKFDTSRKYVSLSNAALDEQVLIDQYFNGFQDGHEIRLRCYKGYQMERDLLVRIQATFPNDVTPGGEISAFDGLVQGHPDFRFNGFPADCKSVPLDEHLPESGRLPRKVFMQMQAYLTYGGEGKALVIYESRETGKIRDFWIPGVVPVMKSIYDKYDRVVRVIQSRM